MANSSIELISKQLNGEPTITALVEASEPGQNSDINISDVIDVIQITDPTSAVLFTEADDRRDADDDKNDITMSNPTAMNGGQLTTLNGNTTPQPMRSPSQPSTSSSASTSNSHSIRRNAFVKITEQPASKALRFRYECEGRSAGSIPGVSSTPENKTFPSIQILGYRGRAVVVVSCVTNQPPHKPHPHNLVGKEGCKKGVCTVEINNDAMSVSFSNLGIQCVKKRDIEEALRSREEIRVDPYRTGFQHRNQPSSIDLNSVRLCFQVFLESETRGRFTVPLAPVVSDPIFDKKAMSDLVICKLSCASSSVAGGKEMILLCEKVAKEDIQVRFFEEHDGNLIWESYGDFQHTNVHKQVAIAFRTPRYKTIDVAKSIKCYIQLKRPSDGLTSESLPFEYIPLDSGRRTLWTNGDGIQESGSNSEFLDYVLAIQKKEEAAKEAEHPVEVEQDQPLIEPEVLVNGNGDESSPIDISEVTETRVEPEPTDSVDVAETAAADKTSEWIRTTEFDATVENGVKLEEADRTLNDLLDHVAELDEIYEDHQLRRDSNHVEEELNGLERALPKLSNDADASYVDDAFDDAATYTSLQIAFKNPVSILKPYPMHEVAPKPPAHANNSNDAHYDAVEPIVNPPAPIIDVKRENEMPPLPPKRVKKAMPLPVENIENRNPKVDDERPLSTGDDSPQSNSISRRSSSKSLQPRPHSQIIIMRPPNESPLNKKLPPAPPLSNGGSCSTLPRPKKPGFFSKIFSRRKSKSDLAATSTVQLTSKSAVDLTREPSVHSLAIAQAAPEITTTKTRTSGRNKSLHNSSGRKIAHGKPCGRSVSSVSGKRPHLTADIVHIPLKGDSSDSLPMRGGNSVGHGLQATGAYERASTVSLSNNLDRKTVSALQLADLPLQDGNMELIAIADRQSLKNLCESEFGVVLDPSVDLTEAEHYALYTTVAPHATQNMGELKRKRTKIDPESILYKQLGNHSPHRHGTNYSHNIMNVQDTSIKTEPADRHSPYPQIYAQTPSPQHNYQPLSPAYNPMNQQHQQQFSPNPPNFANTNTLQPNAYYPPNLHFNHTNNQTDHQMNYMPMQTQQHQPMNQYNISSGPNVFSAPDKPINSTTTPLNIPVDVASAPAARNDSGAINLSGLLDMDGQSYSGEFSNISLSLLEPFQSAGNVEAESSNQPPEENMTDSFTRFTLGQL